MRHESGTREERAWLAGASVVPRERWREPADGRRVGERVGERVGGGSSGGALSGGQRSRDDSSPTATVMTDPMRANQRVSTTGSITPKV